MNLEKLEHLIIRGGRSIHLVIMSLVTNKIFFLQNEGGLIRIITREFQENTL
jgi:hypothetical protein